MMLNTCSAEDEHSHSLEFADMVPDSRSFAAVAHMPGKLLAGSAVPHMVAADHMPEIAVVAAHKYSAVHKHRVVARMEVAEAQEDTVIAN